MLCSKEYYELIEMFDRLHKSDRLAKEAKEYWKMGVVYQDGHLNEKFKEFQSGYAFAKSTFQE